MAEVQFLEEGVVRVRGVLQDKREVGFQLPGNVSPLVGCVLPAMSAADLSPDEEDDGDASVRMVEHAALETLGGKSYFVKAWLEAEQLYLLCNVNGFVVSYVTLGAVEVQRLFNRATKMAEASEAAVEGMVAERAELGRAAVAMGALAA